MQKIAVKGCMSRGEIHTHSHLQAHAHAYFHINNACTMKDANTHK